MTNLIQPSGVPHGVNDHGMKYQTGPVTSTMTIKNTMPLEILAANESGILSSLARLESYQTFSTEARCVNILIGENTMRTSKASTCNPVMVRKRRPDVRTGCHKTANRPSRFNF